MTPAHELISHAKALLLDFDGPVTALMPPPLNAQAADRVRAALSGVHLPDSIATTRDHLAVLRFAVEQAPGRLQAAEQSCTEAEIECARESDPSPEIRDLMLGALRQGVPVAVVSNNSEAAVRVFLDRFEWRTQVKVLACRTPSTVARMKPDPYLVIEAIRLVGLDASECVLIGDSVSDVQAGHSAGVRVVGLAKTVSRAAELGAAGADALLERPVPTAD
jgi:phosphoglycolate phosphatase